MDVVDAVARVVAAVHHEAEAAVDAAREQDSRAFNQHDMSWHSLVWEMSGNEYLQAALLRAVLAG